MNIMNEAHHAFNSLENLSKKIVELKSNLQELVNVLAANKVSDGTGESIEKIPLNKTKTVPKKVAMRIPSKKKKRKR